MENEYFEMNKRDNKRLKTQRVKPRSKLNREGNTLIVRYVSVVKWTIIKN